MEHAEKAYPFELDIMMMVVMMMMMMMMTTTTKYDYDVA
jgi:hypothetical protein